MEQFTTVDNLSTFISDVEHRPFNIKIYGSEILDLPVIFLFQKIIPLQRSQPALKKELVRFSTFICLCSVFDTLLYIISAIC